MNILEIGIEKGRQEGIEEGSLQTLVRNVEAVMKNLNADQHRACEILGIPVEEYEYAKQQTTARDKSMQA